MKKIIDGRRYDTDTAKFLGRYQSTANVRDFYWYSEELYQKRTGEFFLYGEGGPASRYAESTGMNEWSGGERIIPLTVKAAREWAEECLDADEYESIFGECAEDDTKKIVTYSLQTKTIEKVKLIAAQQNMTLSEVIDMVVESY